MKRMYQGYQMKRLYLPQSSASETFGAKDIMMMKIMMKVMLVMNRMEGER